MDKHYAIAYVTLNMVPKHCTLQQQITEKKKHLAPLRATTLEHVLALFLNCTQHKLWYR